MCWNTGSPARSPRGGRGRGASASHSSRPWCAGSATSSRCSAVVAVRGSPVTNSGLRTGTETLSGYARQPASLSSRATSAPRSIDRAALLPAGVSPASRS